MSRLAVIFVVLAVASASAQTSLGGGFSSCVPIADCPSLVDLWASRKAIPGKSVNDVRNFIKSKACGQMRVMCPANEVIEQVHTSEFAEYRPGGVIEVTDVRTDWRYCLGSLKVQTRDANTMEIMPSLAIRRDIERIDVRGNRVAIKAVVEGSCCWQLSAIPRLRGRKQVLGVGHVGRPWFMPRSVAKIQCP